MRVQAHANGVEGNIVSVVGNLILTGTAISPLLLVYALVAFVEGECLPALILALIGLLLFALGVALLRFVKGHLEHIPFSFSTVEVADRESIGMLVLYLLPLLKTSFSDLELLVLIPAIVIFLALALTGYNYHFNPLLNLTGWHFYKVSTAEGVTFVLITRKTIKSAVGQITVGELTAYTVIDLE